MCEHFSIFGAAFPVPPNEIDPFKDITLFITVLDNPAVVGFTICLLLLYLFFCIWAHMNDKNDKKMVCLHYLLLSNRVVIRKKNHKLSMTFYY